MLLALIDVLPAPRTPCEAGELGSGTRIDDERSDQRRGTEDAAECGQDTEQSCGHGPPP
jgi:hypothetical protein